MKLFAAFLLTVLVVQPLAVEAEEFDQARVEQQAMQVLDEFMASFNGRDPVALADTYHFPHYRLARGAMSIWDTKDAAVQSHITTYQTLPDSGWHRSEWLQRRVDAISASKVHVTTRFIRLREDGSEIGTYNSLYILIRKDGVWGIKMRSSYL
jgi:hypothetical protein